MKTNTTIRQQHQEQLWKRLLEFDDLTGGVYTDWHNLRLIYGWMRSRLGWSSSWCMEVQYLCGELGYSLK